MSEEKPVLGLYYDERCEQMLGKKVVDGAPRWLINFGRLDAGKSKVDRFYVKNLTQSTIEDLEVVIESLSEVGVTAEVVSQKVVAELGPDGVHAVDVRWSAPLGQKAALCSGPLLLKGLLVEKEYRYA